MTLFSPPPHRGHWATSIATAFVLALFAFPAAAQSADDRDGAQSQSSAVDDAPEPFNGSFGEWSLRGGPLLPSADGSVGWTGEIGFRNAFPFYLGANRIAYSYGRWSVDDETVQMHGLHASVGIHPFYLALLSEGLTSHFLASLHVELGLGPRFALLPDGDEGTTSGFGLVGSVGGGFDLPITNPNQGRSLWFNTVYRRNWTTIRLDSSDDAGRLHEHAFFFGLSFRSNGIVW